MIDTEKVDEIKGRLTLPYIAGFFDGEGSITVTRDLSLQVCVSQNDESILLAISQYFGCGKVSAVKVRRGHKQCFTLRWCGKKAAYVLSQLVEHLVLKRDRAVLAIEMQAMVVHAHSGRPVPEENWKVRLEKATAIKAANDSHWSRRPNSVNGEVN